MRLPRKIRALLVIPDRRFKPKIVCNEVQTTLPCGQKLRAEIRPYQTTVYIEGIGVYLQRNDDNASIRLMTDNLPAIARFCFKLWRSSSHRHGTF